MHASRTHARTNVCILQLTKNDAGCLKFKTLIILFSCFRLHFITILREPVERFLSEWNHVRNGATWFDVHNFCNGRRATRQEIPFCYKGRNWFNVSLNEFLDCEHNLAPNRQTRMLADLNLVQCFNKSAMDSDLRDQIMLQSAKEHLLKMSFFGLTNYQSLTQTLFENTFNVKFNITLTQRNSTGARSFTNKQQMERILYQNRLDIELYKYAKELFFKRVNQMQQTSPKNCS